MNLFFILLGKIAPLYVNIIIGYVLAHYFKLKRDSIAFLLIYILGPFVVFFATLSIDINMQLVFLPLFVFIFGSTIAFWILHHYKTHWKDASLNTLAFTCGTGNTGYFGIPLAMILLDPQSANIYIFATMASLLYENTTGFYVTAKGNFTAKQSLVKVLRLPLLYAFIFGLMLNVAGVRTPEMIVPYFEGLKWAYGILGMMMLGMGMKGFNLEEDFDKRYIKVAYFYKFLVWPASVLLIIFADSTLFQALNEEIYKVLFLISIVPLAGNTVTLAVLLKAKPEKASFTVLLSTVISIFYIPLVLYLYGGFN
ncbi:AEC family transporter [Candidatus Marinarcus aquaticus]|uniref:Transporter n=1 Tax=Candidatus Marinarcus aquaticus TaxID=2044504 RepID=A0A4Q0XR53_9BACT|nr:AEC family transporter [Candidatus Marinarcus aquaticus]RXJ54489.1 transporter [Candidatus Marinarcus aquaticus]